MRVNKFRIQMRIRKRLQHRMREVIDDVLRDVNAYKRANRDRDERTDEPLAQLHEMLKEGHLTAGLGNLFLTAGVGNLFWILGGRHGEVSDQSLRSQLS